LVVAIRLSAAVAKARRCASAVAAAYWLLRSIKAAFSDCGLLLTAGAVTSEAIAINAAIAARLLFTCLSAMYRARNTTIAKTFGQSMADSQ